MHRDRIDLAQIPLLGRPRIEKRARWSTRQATVNTPGAETETFHAASENSGSIGEDFECDRDTVAAPPAPRATRVGTQTVAENANRGAAFDGLDGIIGEIGDAAIPAIDAVEAAPRAHAADRRLDDHDVRGPQLGVVLGEDDGDHHAAAGGRSDFRQRCR